MTSHQEYIMPIVKKVLLLLLLPLLLTGCKVKYSFTGASISPNVKTVTVKYFPNMSRLPEPALSDNFTNALRNKFTSETNLSNVRANGDLQFEGEIVDYSVTSESIIDNKPARNRLTITVHVVFTNVTEPLKNFDKRFTKYETYESAQSIESVKDNLMRTIVQQLVDDVFLESVANW